MHRLPRAIQLRQQHLIPTRPRIPVRQRVPQRRFDSQIAYTLNGKHLPHQAVRFKKGPFFTQRRLFTLLLYSGATYFFLQQLRKVINIDIELLEDLDEEDTREEQDDEEDDGYASEDSAFIPMTWSTKLPRTFYRGSDPEWQEFVKIAKDKARHSKIQTELVQMIYASATKHPVLQMQLGKDSKVGKYWLDISFPDGPPQEYERAGIEIGHDFIAWSHQKISPEQQWRLMRTLWPSALLNASWASAQTMLGMNYRRIKQALGWESPSPFSIEERYKRAKKMEQQGKGGAIDAHIDPGNSDGSEVDGPSENSQALQSAADGSKPRFTLPLPAQGLMGEEAIPVAVAVFRNTLAKGWNPKKMEPPRGTFVVQGLVEIRGAKGRMTFDVQSCYSPKEAKFVVVNANMRNFKKWNQAPRGGP